MLTGAGQSRDAPELARWYVVKLPRTLDGKAGDTAPIAGAVACLLPRTGVEARMKQADDLPHLQTLVLYKVLLRS